LRLLYFDASALVKAYVAEPGSDCVARIFEAADRLFTCRIAFAEVLATFRRKRNESPSLEFQTDQLVNEFCQDWSTIETVDLNPGLLDVVREKAFRHSLRALDLLHLSAACWLREVVRIPVTLISSDQPQLAAARHESLPVFDPERDDPALLG
jgi:predicted nucleic acid-binding protein